jgi:hypothetical protein
VNEHPDLDELWLDLITEALPEREARSIRAHLDVCEVCRARFGELEGAHKLSLRAGRIAAREDAPAVPAALEAATFRAVRKAASSPTGQRPWLAPALVGAGVAAAMTLLVDRSFVVSGFERRPASSSSPPTGSSFSLGEARALLLRRSLGSLHPCELLKPAEILGLAPKGHISEKDISFLPGGPFGCKYEWEAGTDAASGHFALQIVFGAPLTDSATTKEGVLSMARDGGPNATVVSDLGDAAVFLSDSANWAAVTAYVKGVLLQVSLEGPDARARKDQIIALLKAAAARL